MHVNSGRVHLWKTAHNIRFVQDYTHRMVDVAMATSAAPTYFKAYLTETGAPLVDGGVFANNPRGPRSGGGRWRPQLATRRNRDPQPRLRRRALDVRTSDWWRSGIVGIAPKMAAVFMAAQSDASCGTATHLIGNRDNFIRTCSSPIRPCHWSLSTRSPEHRHCSRRLRSDARTPRNTPRSQALRSAAHHRFARLRAR
jgi:hypothetical protein